MNMNINFPHLGIELEHVGRSISILGFHITYYGMLIGLALVAGIFITIYFAVKSRQNIEHYLDLVIGTVLWGVVGARLYYVLFSWDRYQGHFFRIFNFHLISYLLNLYIFRNKSFKFFSLYKFFSSYIKYKWTSWLF